MMDFDSSSLQGFYDRKVFNDWQKRAREAENEELLLKRKEELNSLVRKVIKQELSAFDRRLVELHWYKGMTKSEIALMLGIDRSTVHRHFTAINDTVYEKLKYAVELIYGPSGNMSAEKLIYETGKSYSSHINSDEISKRVKSLRASGCFTIELVSDKTGISQLRLKQLERKGSTMTMAELKKLTDFYKISTNYIIFGAD